MAGVEAAVAQQISETFGVEYVDPGAPLRDVALDAGGAPGAAAREAAGPPGVRTKAYANPFLGRAAAGGGGAAAAAWDMYSAEEIAKREARAAKFGTIAPSATIRPTEEQLAAEKVAEEAKAAAAAAVEEQRAKAVLLAQERAKRAERFGIEGYDAARDADAAAAVGMDVSGGEAALDFLEEAKDAPPGVEVRPEAVHLYGTDAMSTREIFEYFRAHEPTHVEWINDSSCNVVFANMHAAKRAMYRLRKPALDNPLVPDFANYIDGVPFPKDGVDIPLKYRLASHADVKQFNPNHKTRRLWVKGGVGKGNHRGRGASRLDQPLGGGGGMGLSKSAKKRAKRRERQLAAGLASGQANVKVAAGTAGGLAGNGNSGPAAMAMDGGGEVDNGGSPDVPVRFARERVEADDMD
eukprot:PRCOL_00000571-RA